MIKKENIFFRKMFQVTDYAALIFRFISQNVKKKLQNICLQ